MSHGDRTDLGRLQGWHTTYLYGPGGTVPGRPEGLTVMELEDAVEGYKKLIMHALQPRFPPRKLHAGTCAA
jgi:hypothetical protein